MADTKELSILEAQFSLVPRNLTEAMEFSKLIAGTSLVPKSYRDKDGKVNPGDILIAVQMGLEVGLKPLQAIQNIAVINGQPTLWGDSIRGLVEASGKMEYCLETWDEKTQTATCKVKRVGKPEHVQTFSMADAAKADLAKKDTYQKYPKRMCGARARAWAFRNEFPDILKGLQFREEVDDYETVTTTEQGVEIQRPRRKSEAAAHETPVPLVTPATEIAEQVEKFASEPSAAPAVGAGAKAQIDRTKLESVQIIGSVQRQGNGKTFYAITVGRPGNVHQEVTTFDSKIFDEAKRIEGCAALILTKANGKFTNITHIEAADEPPAQDEPGSNG